MKRISTLAMLALMGAAVASAQDEGGEKSFKLEKNRVIYVTCDTVTYEDGETYGWCANDVVNSFNAAGMAFEGADATDWNYAVAFRQDYKDPETGFTLNKGYYRGLTLFAKNTTENLYGLFINPTTNEELNHTLGFKNLKKVILYYVCLPDAKCSSHGYNYNHNALPSNGGRVVARYMNEDGTALSNTAYRDPSVSVSLVSDGGGSWAEWLNTLSKDGCHFEMLQDDAFTLLGYNPALVTVDRPFKFAVDLTNSLPTSEYEDFESETKKSEYAKLSLDNLTELETSYYFADASDCNPYTDNAEATATSATGYNCYANRWGKKVDWTADTPIQIGIKGRLYLMGFALVCGTEGAETEYMNASDFMSARFTTEPTAAYGNPVDVMPQDSWGHRRLGNGTFDPDLNPNAITSINADKATNTPVYNLAGQRVSADTKGILIQNGKKIVNQ